MLEHADTSEKALGCCFEVIKELGAGFVESVYEKAMLVALRDKGVGAEAQVPLRVLFRGHCVGEFFADIVVQDAVIVELKAVKTLAPEHQAQLINYLNASGKTVGLLVNFGNARLEYKRLYGKGNKDKQDGQDKKQEGVYSIL